MLLPVLHVLHAAVAWNAARDKRGQNADVDVGSASRSGSGSALQTIVACFLRIPKFKSKTPHGASSDAGRDSSSCSRGSAAGKLDRPRSQWGSECNKLLLLLRHSEARLNGIQVEFFVYFTSFLLPSSCFSLPSSIFGCLFWTLLFLYFFNFIALSFAISSSHCLPLLLLAFFWYTSPLLDSTFFAYCPSLLASTSPRFAFSFRFLSFFSFSPPSLLFSSFFPPSCLLFPFSFPLPFSSAFVKVLSSLLFILSRLHCRQGVPLNTQRSKQRVFYYLFLGFRCRLANQTMQSPLRRRQLDAALLFYRSTCDCISAQSLSCSTAAAGDVWMRAMLLLLLLLIRWMNSNLNVALVSAGPDPLQPHFSLSFLPSFELQHCFYFLFILVYILCLYLPLSILFLSLSHSLCFFFSPFFSLSLSLSLLCYFIWKCGNLISLTDHLVFSLLLLCCCCYFYFLLSFSASCCCCCYCCLCHAPFRTFSSFTCANVVRT